MKDEKEQDLFRLVVVNSYGSEDVRKLVDDPKKMLQLSGKYFCCVFVTDVGAPLRIFESCVKILTCLQTFKEILNGHNLDIVILSMIIDTLLQY